MSELATLNDWLSTLPPFRGGPPTVTLFSRGRGVTLYRINGEGESAVLKHFSPLSAPEAKRDKRHEAEAAALRQFAPLDLAPELLWEGQMPAPIAGNAVIYRWLDGESAAGKPLTLEQVDLLAATLHAVHSSPADLTHFSPAPRTLDAWWLRTHELYREMQTHFAQEMHADLSDALVRLLQAIAADTQAHKRFWQGAVLVPVHGRPEPANFIFRSGGAALKNWQGFGMGDPSHEVASAARMIASQSGEEAAVHLVKSYLAGTDDVMLARRLALYLRLWPFGHVLSALAARMDSASEQLPPSSEITFHVKHILSTYNWQGDTGSVISALTSWLDKNSPSSVSKAHFNNGRAATQP